MVSQWLFSSLAKVPVPSERLTILVIRGNTCSSISLSIFVGIGSNSQDLVSSDVTTFLTSSSVKGANSVSLGVSDTSHTKAGVVFKILVSK